MHALTQYLLFYMLDAWLPASRQPAGRPDCPTKGFSLWVAYSVSSWNKTGGALILAADAESPHLQTVGQEAESSTGTTVYS
jgi:hypothetical protein